MDSENAGLMKTVGVALASFVAGWVLHARTTSQGKAITAAAAPATAAPAAAAPVSTPPASTPPICVAASGAGAGADESDSDDDSTGGRIPYACKMVLLVNTSLKMGKGKVSAQCCHACLGAYEHACSIHPEWVHAWRRRGQAKITLKLPSETMMEEIVAACEAQGLPHYVVVGVCC
jgi:peptidyl-tRNA hydrolase